jgi:hypothetical protein
LWQPVNPLVIPGWVLAVDLVLVVAACILIFVIKVPFAFVPAVVIPVLFTAVATVAQRRWFLSCSKSTRASSAFDATIPSAACRRPGVCPECREQFEAGSLARIWGIWLRGVTGPLDAPEAAKAEIISTATPPAPSGGRDADGQN